MTEAQLPGDVNGLELCRRVALQRPDVQLVITATSPELSHQDLPGNVRVLRKPYASRELRTLVADKASLADA